MKSRKETETDVQDDVSFLKIKSARLEDKQLPKYASQLEMLKGQVSDVDSILPITSCKEVLFFAIVTLPETTKQRGEIYKLYSNREIID